MASQQDQIDALRSELGRLRDEIPPAIARGLRIFSDRPAGEKGSPSMQFGRVEGVFADQGYCTVILDGETASIPVSMLAGLAEGDRVAVLFVPPSGALALGVVNPAGATTGGLAAMREDVLTCTISMPANDGSGGSLGQAAWFVSEALHFAHVSGDVLVDDTNPFSLRFLQSGKYALTMLAGSTISLTSSTPFVALFNSFDLAGVLPAPIGNWVLPGGGLDLATLAGSSAPISPFGVSGSIVGSFDENGIMAYLVTFLNAFATASPGDVVFTLIVTQLDGDTVGSGTGVSPTNYPPHFLNTDPPGPVNGVPYSYTFTAAAVPAPTYSVATGTIGGALPAGLTLNPTTGRVSGTPLDATGPYAFTIQAANGQQPPARFLFAFQLTD
jgi:hypothetical protein